ncbi:hypothetical protein Tco_0509477 [Tanacetum coccineum]
MVKYSYSPIDGRRSSLLDRLYEEHLQTDDAKGVDCLPNATIFEQLTLMGFVQVFLDKQLEGMSNHKRIYVTPFHTKKIFRNMKRVGKGFSGKVTPLFPTMVEVKENDTEVLQPSGPITNVADEAVNKEMDDSLVRAATTASSLEANSGGGPRRQETMGDIIAHTRVINLETTKTTQANEIASLKRRVKNLEKKNKSRTRKLKRLYKVGLSKRVESCKDEESLGEDASKQGRRITDIDDDEDITLVNDQIDADAEMFDVDTLTGDEVLAEQVVAAKDVNLSVDEVTLAQALAALKNSVATTTTATILTPRKGIVFQEPGTTTTTTTISSQQPSHANFQDKGKVKMVEPEKPMKKKELIRLDEEIASKLQAEFDEEAKIEADHELAQRLQAQEQEELSDAEKATLFVQLLEKRRKHFAAKRAEEKRNKPPTQAQQRKIIAFKRVNTFVDFRTDLVEGSSKRAGEELEQESSKKQKVDDDKETAELKSLMEVIPDEEEVALDAIPLAVKSLSIVDWKIHKEGKKSYYQIIRADGSLETPVKDLDLVLYGDLKIIFEPHVEDNVWKNQSDYRVLDWKLYDSCGVHSLRKQNVHIHMLVEKRYPLTAPIVTDMLNKKFQCDHLSEIAYQLLKIPTKQLKNQ